MSVRKLKNGRWQADVSDERRGIPRTKRTFDTKKQAEEWKAAVRTQAHNRLLGRRERRLFGEALAEYLANESPSKKTHIEDLGNARALRWPVQDGKQWLRLELVPMDDGPDGIIAALAKWTADMKRVKQRAYIGGEIYHLRPNDKGDLVWYHQPDPAEGKQPAPRYEVTDAKLLARLAKNKGRGPFAPNTLRVRQVLVSATLGYAWRQLRWLEHDIASLIACEKLGPGREIDLSYDQVLAILIAAPVGFDEAMLGAAWIGWRRGNVLGMPKRRGRPEREGLTWARTVFPVWQENPETRERTLLQLGYVQTLRGETKNGDPLVQPMSERLEQLLRLRWDQRNGALVFHRGDGSPWHEYRRIWRSTLKRARQFVEIPVSFRWHDFRHIWAAELTRAGATTRQLMELGGWRDEKMPKLYAHLDAKHLLDVVNAPARRNGG